MISEFPPEKDGRVPAKKSDGILFFIATLFLVTAVVAFIYRKQLVKGIINSNISLIPISSAVAQTTGAERFFEGYQGLKINGSFSSISASPDVLGFGLRANVDQMPEGCDEAISPFFLTAFVYSDISDEDHFIKVNDCLKKTSGKKKFVFSFGGVQVPVSKAEKQMVEAVWKQLSAGGAILDLVNEELLKLDFKSGKDLSKISSLLSAFEGSDMFAARLSTIYLYAGVGNFGKVDRLLRKYLGEVEYNAYFGDEFYYKKSVKTRENCAALLGITKKILGKNRLFDAFVLKAREEASLETGEEFDSVLDTPFKKDKALSLVNSPTLGTQTPLAWTWWVQRNLSPSARKRAFSKIPVSSLPQNLQVLRFFYPETAAKRRGYSKAFGILSKSQNPVKRALYFDIFKNQEWEKYYLANFGEGFRPLFRQKREFYSHTFEQNRGILFSIFNLYQLGDFRREHFLKALAIRSYGLPSTQILPL